MNITHGQAIFTRLPKGTKFAAISETVRQTLKPLMPATQHLFLKLGNQHRAGWVFEFDCKEYAEEVGYSLRQVYRAVDQLQEAGLLVVEKVIGWGRRYFKGHWQYPATTTEMSKISQACPEKNLEASLHRTSYTDLNRQIPPPTHGEEIDNLNRKTVEESLNSKLYNQCRSLGIKLSWTQFQSYLEKFSENSLSRAIQVLKQATNVRNATGYFIHALRAGLDPEQVVVTTGFNEWFNQARAAGIAVGSMARDGEIEVALRRSDGEIYWQVFDEGLYRLLPSG